MKYLGVVAIIALAFVFLHADGAETDVVRVFDPKVKLPARKEMLNILKKANLEKFGFKKTVESTIETDENGDKRVKKMIHYMVTAKCSEAAYWEGVLEERLPSNFLSSNTTSKLLREIQSRIKGRKPKLCKIGLEIHVNPDCPKNSTETRSLKKRSTSAVDWCFCIGTCSSAIIVY